MTDVTERQSGTLENKNELETQKKLSTSNKKYLVFKLENEKYAAALSSVKEVIGMCPITDVPQVPKYFKGLINLRGKIISVIDLRVKLNLGEADFIPKKTSIIITEVNNLMVGLIVDDVIEVGGYCESQIEREFEFNTKVHREYLDGIAKTEDDELVLVMNIHSVIGISEIQEITENQISA